MDSTGVPGADSALLERLRSALTARIYPTRPDSVGLRVFARDGRARARTLDLWRMRGIWPEGGE